MPDTNPYMGKSRDELNSLFLEICEEGFTTDAAELHKVHAKAENVAKALEALGAHEDAADFRNEFGKLDFSATDTADQEVARLREMVTV